MIYLPPLRRFLLPVFVLVAFVVLYRGLPVPGSLPSFIIHQSPTPPDGVHVPANSLRKSLQKSNASDNHMLPPSRYFFDSGGHTEASGNRTKYALWQPILDENLDVLFECRRRTNNYTGHIRLPNILRNISQIPQDDPRPDPRIFWNPTIIALPHWSENQYLVVSRIVTDGNHQENVLCEANICYVGSGENATKGEKPCTPEDLEILGPAGGMRCVHAPKTLSVPPTPAEKCEGKFATYADIPGFHDPRIFWSGRGEPLMMCNTQSRYACFGLWLIDLRALHPPLEKLLASSPTRPSLGPLKSYPSLTELTRNPPSTRSAIEKNWMLFFPPNGEAYVHYDLPPLRDDRHGRTFAKLLGNGLTTTNLTDPMEENCLLQTTKEEEGNVAAGGGQWHQATNSLRLILCDCSDPRCKPTPEKTVFFALVHRKFSNILGLPQRYERFFLVWSATPPFGMLAISSQPILMANETGRGWSPAETWEDDPEKAAMLTERAKSFNATLNSTNATGAGEKPHWAEFTYTVSLAYAWGRQPRKGSEGDESEDMHVGYLDDDVVLGIGVDDAGSVFSKVQARELVSCMRACPGRTKRASETESMLHTYQTWDEGGPGTVTP